MDVPMAAIGPGVFMRRDVVDERALEAVRAGNESPFETSLAPRITDATVMRRPQHGDDWTENDRRPAC
jgi:hypothetical protein